MPWSSPSRRISALATVLGLTMLTLPSVVVCLLGAKVSPSRVRISSDVEGSVVRIVSRTFLSSLNASGNPVSVAAREDAAAPPTILPTTQSTPTIRWLDNGLLLSSFSDGLVPNPAASNWLMNALVETLWQEHQWETQTALRESNLASPCNGPDPHLLDELERTDKVIEGIMAKEQDEEVSNSGASWKSKLSLLLDTLRSSDASNDPVSIELRMVYIPTAMYALQPGSTRTPGKQRRQNRADGKKRRNTILQWLEGQCSDAVQDSASLVVKAVTLDLDDASVKQPEEFFVGGTKTIGDTGNSQRFPETGKEALREWKPHLVYVQGGNTFWLHHCMEKGDWANDLLAACGYKGGSYTAPSAVYCGVSAGAILAGASMQTACWKEWDDPAVVPGKEMFSDWTDSLGLDVCGKASIFPHMNEEWEETTERKTRELLESSTPEEEEQRPASVICLRDDQAYAVKGRTQSLWEL